MKYAAGSRITFVRRNSMSAEELFINGPITEPLKVMVATTKAALW